MYQLLRNPIGARARPLDYMIIVSEKYPNSAHNLSLLHRILQPITITFYCCSNHSSCSGVNGGLDDSVVVPIPVYDVILSGV